MKILIVGGAGYLGGAVTDLLLKTKHSIRVYDSLLYEESYRKEVDFIFGDIRDRKKLSSVTVHVLLTLRLHSKLMQSL